MTESNSQCRRGVIDQHLRDRSKKLSTISTGERSLPTCATECSNALCSLSLPLRSIIDALPEGEPFKRCTGI